MTAEKLSALLEEKRWPQDPNGFPAQWNRVGGLLDLCEKVFGHRIPDATAPNPDIKIVEIGVAAGVSTEVFAEYGIVDGIDYAMWSEATKRFEGREENVRLIQADSFSAAELFPDRAANVIYLDSRHDYEHVRDEIRAWRSKVKFGGWMSGHDHCEMFPGVQRAVREELDGPDFVFSDSSWLKRMP